MSKTCVYATNTLNFDHHNQKKCQIAHVQLRNLKQIRRHLTQKSTALLVQRLVHSHIDICNGLFADIPSYQIDKLQRVQNHAARLVTNALFDQTSTDLLKQLHWLPMRARNMFKIIVTVFRIVHDTAPNYRQEMFTQS
jgi:hypothetical protein